VGEGPHVAFRSARVVETRAPPALVRPTPAERHDGFAAGMAVEVETHVGSRRGLGPR